MASKNPAVPTRVDRVILQITVPTGLAPLPYVASTWVVHPEFTVGWVTESVFCSCVNGCQVEGGIRDGPNRRRSAREQTANARHGGSE